MRTEVKDAPPKAPAGQTSDDDLDEVLARIAALGAETESPGAFLHESLRRVAALFGSPYAALEFAIAAEGQIHRHEEPGEGRAADTWRLTLQDRLTDALTGASRPRLRLLEARSRGVRAALLSSPIPDGRGGRAGAIVCVTAVADDSEARVRLAELERVATHLALHLPRPRSQAAGREQAFDASAIARAASFSSPVRLAFAVTNGLRARTECNLVALGMVRRGRVVLLSISGADDVKDKSPGVRAMRAAMEEALDRGEATVWPRDDEWTERSGPENPRLHQAWSEKAGAAAVATVVVPGRSGAALVLAFRRPAEKPFGCEEVERLKAATASYGAALELVHRAHRSMLRHLFDSVSESLAGLRSRAAWPGLALKLALAALLGFLAFGRLDHEVSAGATLTRPDRRQVASPVSGALVEVRVAPGDEVAAGQVLCVFDARDSELELLRLRAERSATAVEERRALAEGRTVDRELARARIASLEASIAVVEHRISEAVVRAPIDGIVLEGDLKARIGDRVGIGEPLFEVAPEREWLVEVALDESDFALVDPGARGRFATRARPDLAQEITLGPTRPRTEQRDGRNVVVVEALCDIQDPWVRAGMEGRASVETGRRPVWWVLSRPLLDWFRLELWP